MCNALQWRKPQRPTDSALVGLQHSSGEAWRLSITSRVSGFRQLTDCIAIRQLTKPCFPCCTLLILQLHLYQFWFTLTVERVLFYKEARSIPRLFIVTGMFCSGGLDMQQCPAEHAPGRNRHFGVLLFYPFSTMGMHAGLPVCLRRDISSRALSTLREPLVPLVRTPKPR